MKTKDDELSNGRTKLFVIDKSHTVHQNKYPIFNLNHNCKNPILIPIQTYSKPFRNKNFGKTNLLRFCINMLQH
jgi:hypothetical protein